LQLHLASRRRYQNNGCERASVSLTRLDQSDIKHFNPSSRQEVANKQTEANQAREIEADLAVKRRSTEMERDLQIVAQESSDRGRQQGPVRSQTIAETARAVAIAAEKKVTATRARRR
jgi:hypothetical protein